MERSIRHVSLRSDCVQVVFVGLRGEAELWDLGSPTRVWKSRLEVRDWDDSVRVAFSPRNDLIAWLEDHFLEMLDAISGEKKFRLDSSDRWPFLDIAWDADGRQLLTNEWRDNGKDNNSTVRIWDVASARSTKQANLLFQFDTPHRVTFCSFFNSHRSIVTDHGIFAIPAEHRPACAAGDLGPPETVLRLRKDGWIWQVGGGKSDRRVCWLPPTYRRIDPRFNKSLIISRSSVKLITDSGRLVSLDLKIP